MHPRTPPTFSSPFFLGTKQAAGAGKNGPISGGEERERPSAPEIDLSSTQPHPHSPQLRQQAAVALLLQEDINGPWTVTGGRHQRWLPRSELNLNHGLTGILPPLLLLPVKYTSSKKT